ncbi:MAG: glucoamylase family protein [Flavisolibacter sp.]
MKKILVIAILSISFLDQGCGKKTSDQPTPVTPVLPLELKSFSVNGSSAAVSYDISIHPSIVLKFSAPVDRSSLASGISLSNNTITAPYTSNFSNGDSTIAITPSASLHYLSRYQVNLSTNLKSASGGNLSSVSTINFVTSIDSSDKFPRINDSALVQLVQQQTFKYFWDFAHPTSGLARERNTSGDVVTTGGSGFGIMALIVGVNRGFISHAQGLAQMQKIVGFLKTTAQKFHGAFPHWLNGQTGVVVPFSTKDDGADLVETSYLMQGLLCARQYFNGSDASETSLRSDINLLWNGVEWNWFRRNNENVLYWHWSSNYNWDMNVPIRGWNEALITYVLASSSTNYSIPKIVYDQGWAQNGSIRNNNAYYGLNLPLGPPYGGPLFFSHYSFLGINPFGLSDAYANYQEQVVNHTKINYSYCVANPSHFYGYSTQCWGLSASDVPGGYAASSPTNDIGVIAPTAALSSFPYTPTESMNALKFFYYQLGDKLWGDYGFHDAFSLKDIWFADSWLAIDEGPIVVMTENYRSGLLWNLFMSCPEIKTGMKNLGFQSPLL